MTHHIVVTLNDAGLPEVVYQSSDEIIVTVVIPGDTYLIDDDLICEVLVVNENGTVDVKVSESLSNAQYSRFMRAVPAYKLEPYQFDDDDSLDVIDELDEDLDELPMD